MFHCLPTPVRQNPPPFYVVILSNPTAPLSSSPSPNNNIIWNKAKQSKRQDKTRTETARPDSDRDTHPHWLAGGPLIVLLIPIGERRATHTHFPFQFRSLDWALLNCHYYYSAVYPWLSCRLIIIIRNQTKLIQPLNSLSSSSQPFSSPTPIS